MLALPARQVPDSRSTDLISLNPCKLCRLQLFCQERAYTACARRFEAVAWQGARTRVRY